MEPDGSVELDGIQAQFPGITGIKYRNPATQVSENTAVFVFICDSGCLIPSMILMRDCWMLIVSGDHWSVVDFAFYRTHVHMGSDHWVALSLLTRAF